jgi:hypothetical protein
MGELSSAAQAVRDAYVNRADTDPYYELLELAGLAAALRAAATYCTKSGGDFWQLNSIADELENHA